MNIHEIKVWIEGMGSVLSLLKTAKDLLPDGHSKSEVASRIFAAEDVIKRADAKLAQSLGRHLCPSCWPPEIMRIGARYDQFSCSKCGRNPPQLPPIEFLDESY